MPGKAPLVVVGDALLDRDLTGTAERLAPDAPVPVVADCRQRVRPGGAALAAYLAARDGREVTLITGLGDDPASEQLRRLLAPEVELIDLPLAGALPEKTRVLAQGTPVVRLDRGTGRVREATEEARAALRSAPAVLVSDYGRGAVDSLRDVLAGRPPLLWDPHPRGGPPVPGTRLVSPARAEARTFADHEGNGDSLRDAARDAAALVRHWRVAAVAVTLGASGALLSYGEHPLLVPAGTAHRGDTCGAGDRFAATAAGLLADGALVGEAVEGAVAAATEFVGAGGAGGVTQAAADAVPAVGTDPSVGVAAEAAPAAGNLAAAPAVGAGTGAALAVGNGTGAAPAVGNGTGAGAVLAVGNATGKGAVPTVGTGADGARAEGTRAAARADGTGTYAARADGTHAAAPEDGTDAAGTRDLVARVRATGGTVVAAGGCFDLLHAGHVGLLQAARRLGDCLVVCVNSDASVRRRKGAERPVNPLADRVRVLLALACVDAVAVFDEDTPERLLADLRPDIWVKGGDYSGADLPEAALLQEWGGQAVLLPYLDGRSSTALAARVREGAR